MPSYNSFKKDILTGSISLSSDCANGLIKIILVSASYTPDIDAHQRYTSVSAHEISFAHPAFAQGYNSTGHGVSGGTFTQDDGDNEGVWDSPDISWASSTITARYAVLVKVRNLGLDKQNDNLIAYFDFGSDKSSSSGTFTLQFDTEGILNITP